MCKAVSVQREGYLPVSKSERGPSLAVRLKGRMRADELAALRQRSGAIDLASLRAAGAVAASERAQPTPSRAARCPSRLSKEAAARRCRVQACARRPRSRSGSAQMIGASRHGTTRGARAREVSLDLLLAHCAPLRPHVQECLGDKDSAACTLHARWLRIVEERSWPFAGRATFLPQLTARGGSEMEARRARCARRTEQPGCRHGSSVRVAAVARIAAVRPWRAGPSDTGAVPAPAAVRVAEREELQPSTAALLAPLREGPTPPGAAPASSPPPHTTRTAYPTTSHTHHGCPRCCPRWVSAASHAALGLLLLRLRAAACTASSALLGAQQLILVLSVVDGKDVYKVSTASCTTSHACADPLPSCSTTAART
jgi:hypothetical protein